jgi:hypothetical protein
MCLLCYFTAVLAFLPCGDLSKDMVQIRNGQLVIIPSQLSYGGPDNACLDLVFTAF